MAAIKQVKGLCDSTLLDELKSLVRREKEIVVEVIEYLKEIEIRKLHLARGYSSLFSFATEFLGYSEAEAHIRIQAARLSQSLPEVRTLIESGELSLSVAASAQTHFRRENLRRKEAGKMFLSAQEKREALKSVAGSSRREAEQNLNIHFAQPSRTPLRIEVSPELKDKISRLMDLMAHKNFDRNIDKMIELLVDAELARYEKKLALQEESKTDHGTKTKPTYSCSEGGLFGLRSESDATQPHTGTSQIQNGKSPVRAPLRLRRKLSRIRRHIPRATQALLWTKHNGACAYRDPISGKRCNSTHALQIDHRVALAKGGSNDPENLALLCANHNLWKADRAIELAE